MKFKKKLTIHLHIPKRNNELLSRDESKKLIDFFLIMMDLNLKENTTKNKPNN